MPAPELSVLLVNYNTWQECAGAIRSLRDCPPRRDDGSPMPYECIVVDNCSPRQPADGIAALRDELAAVVREQGDPQAGQLILHGENLGYSRGMNLCFAHSRGRWIVISNPDLLYTEGLLDALRAGLQRNPRAGCTVPKGYWDSEFIGGLPPNTLPSLVELLWTTAGDLSRRISSRYAMRLVRRWCDVWLDERPRALRMMSGCLLMVERGYWQSIGMFDERFPLYYEDADLSIRIARSGRQVVQVPEARLVHFVNRSGMTDEQTMQRRHDASRRLYFDKYYGWFGRLLLWASRALLDSGLGRRLRKTGPHGPWTDLGSSAEPPRIPLGRHCERFLLLMGLDARFYLSGGIFGSGDHWTPTPAMFRGFGATTYWYRAFDLSGGRFEPIGTFRFQCLSHLGVAPGRPAEARA